MKTFKDLPLTDFNFITDINEDDSLIFENISKEALKDAINQEILRKLSLISINPNIADITFVLFETPPIQDQLITYFYFENPSLQNDDDVFFYLVIDRDIPSNESPVIFLNNIRIDIIGLIPKKGFNKGYYSIQRKNNLYYLQIPLQKNARYYSFYENYAYLLKNSVDQSSSYSKDGYLFSRFVFNTSSLDSFTYPAFKEKGTYSIPNKNIASNSTAFTNSFFIFNNSACNVDIPNIPISARDPSSNSPSDIVDWVADPDTKFIPKNIELCEVYYD